ncbi:unnamed protein product [Nezara viridula]|uniref:Uncharacterized protein n=1 Tax=Nezara viridula TaxID=85310 RepID=A0A9P0E1S6_NEZVI|nr:unnamed protein product [Nezara viridula]
MYRTLILSILLCFVTFHVGITNSLENKVDQKPEVVPLADEKPEPTRHPSTEKPSSTPDPTTVPPTNATTTPAPPTTPTTTKPPKPTDPTTPTTTVPSSTTTNSSTTTSNPTTPTTSPTTPTPSPTTNGTSTVSPSTTSAPLPPPSDRKFDAFSFLGGFALGLGLVAIGFLSWKFYLSRQENYYHTL